MTLREQLLSELRQQNEIAQQEIKDLESTISAEAFAMSTVTGGALAGAARSACQNRMQVASAKKDRVKQQNAWISEMLSKYK
jgi:hypothetical protein